MWDIPINEYGKLYELQAVPSNKKEYAVIIISFKLASKLHCIDTFYVRKYLQELAAPSLNNVNFLKLS